MSPTHLLIFAPLPRACWAIWATKWVQRHENYKLFRAFGGGGGRAVILFTASRRWCKSWWFQWMWTKAALWISPSFCSWWGSQKAVAIFDPLDSVGMFRFSLHINVHRCSWQESSWTRSAAIGGQESPAVDLVILRVNRCHFGGWASAPDARKCVRQRGLFCLEEWWRGIIFIHKYTIHINTHIKMIQNISLAPFCLIWFPTSFWIADLYSLRQYTDHVQCMFLPLCFCSVTCLHVFVRQLKFIWWWHVDACCGRLFCWLLVIDSFFQTWTWHNRIFWRVCCGSWATCRNRRRLQSTAAWERQRVDACRFEVEAIRDAAADSNISLGAIMCGAQHGSTHPAKKNIKYIQIYIELHR